MQTGTLSLQQAPPLSIPASFFLCIPLGILAAAGILLTTGSNALISPWTTQALALTHAGTLGVLAMGMLGALYQMTPVVAGSPVPWTRIAHLSQLLLLAGLTGFLWRLLGGPGAAMAWAIIGFKLAFTALLLPLGWALLRAGARGATVGGMRLAIVSLAVVVLIGVAMARGYADGAFPDKRLLWLQIHLQTALLGWVGGLIMAVSWQVIPMFYLAPTMGKTALHWLLGLLLAGLLLPLASALATAHQSTWLTPAQWAAISALPAAMAIWLLHPLLVLRGISRRRRKRGDASLWFWKAGLGAALLLIPIAITIFTVADSRWQVMFGWVAIWGWAGMIMHGMLSRILPFLVWFHRYSARIGLATVPSMRSLLSQARIQTSFVLHASSVVLGAAAILARSDRLAQVTGLLLAATAFSLASMLLHVLKRTSA